jgi:hypothetical protein
MRKKGDEAEDKKAKPGGINQLALPNRAKKVNSLLPVTVDRADK